MNNQIGVPPRLQSATIPTDIDYPPKYLPLKSLNRYHIVSNLGNGSFGNVVLAKRRDMYSYSVNKMNTLMNPIAGVSDVNSQLVAIKTMNKRLPNLKDYTKVKEIRFILSIPSHANLVFVHEIFIDNVDFKLHIVMETMNQNLYQLMKSRKGQVFSPNSVKCILTQLLLAIQHIHKFGYFHRDVKPENILISPNINSQNYSINPAKPYIVKLADYGLARSVTNTRPYTSYVSTRWYRPPEILLRQKHYSCPVDVWAFGAVAVEVATFRPLFPGNNELDQTWKVLEVLGSPTEFTDRKPLGGYWLEAKDLAANLGFRLPYTKGVQLEQIIQRPELAQLIDVIKGCLTWDPSLRYDVETLTSMPYFNNRSHHILREMKDSRVEKSHSKQRTSLLKKSIQQFDMISLSHRRKHCHTLSDSTNLMRDSFSNYSSSIESDNLDLELEKARRNDFYYSIPNEIIVKDLANTFPNINTENTA